jgi:diguanylate cyclase (GGDEF)-like protein
MPLAEKAGLWEEVLDDTLKLSDIHRRLGDWQASAAALRQAYDLRNRMFEEERVRLTREIEARYESEKKQKEYNLLRHEIRIKALDLNQKSLQISFLLALSALALIMALILYNRYRFRLKAHQELEQANRQIQEKQVQLTEANRRLDELAREDPLTGLANRREILSRFDQERVRSLRSGRPFSVIMADLDDFKVYNDTYGHNCGDDILKTLASLLRSMIRGQDVVGRWGGDEFLILLPETRLNGGEAVARKVRAKVRRTAFPWKEKNLKVQLSLGVSVYKKGMDFDDCLKSADQAMFRHKRRRKSVRLPA